MKKTWFITGCDSGMGQAVSEVLLSKGDNVIVTALNLKNIQYLLNKYPENSIGYELNVTDNSQINYVVDEAFKKFKKIDVLFNNAGYGVMGAAEESLEEEYRPMFDVNFFGLASVTKKIISHMRLNRSGVVFNTSSLGGYAASPGFAFYAASKFAVEGFTDALAQEVKNFNIKVMLIEAGSFRTKFASSSLKLPSSPIRDYETTSVATTLSRMKCRDGNQPNDPKKLGEALYFLSRCEELPLRIPFGEDALNRVTSKANESLLDFKKWESLSLSVGFDK